MSAPLQLLHNSRGLPIHANGPVLPHITIQDFGRGGTWHVPFEGQSTLNMWFQGESFRGIEGLGKLNAERATIRKW